MKKDEKVTIKDRHGVELKQVIFFKYLGWLVTDRGGSEKEVQSRLNASWLKWKEVKPIKTDKRIPMRLKGKVCTTLVRPVLTCGSECWGLKKKDQRKLLTTEMSMLQKRLGVTLRDKLRNEEVRRRTVMTIVVTTVEQKKTPLVYGHVLRKKKEDVVKQALEELVRRKRSRGRQLKRWKDGLSERLEELSLRKQDARDRQRWRRGIMTTDSEQRE